MNFDVRKKLYKLYKLAGWGEANSNKIQKNSRFFGTGSNIHKGRFHEKTGCSFWFFPNEGGEGPAQIFCPLFNCIYWVNLGMWREGETPAQIFWHIGVQKKCYKLSKLGGGGVEVIWTKFKRTATFLFYLRLTFPRDSQPGPSSSRQSQNCASWAHSRRRLRATAVSRNWEITNSGQTISLVGFYHLDKSSTTYSLLGLAEKVSSSLSSIPWSIPNGSWCFSAWVEMSWFLPK